MAESMLTPMLHNSGSNIRSVMFGLSGSGLLNIFKGLIDHPGWN
jgi:hypothetical protein